MRLSRDKIQRMIDAGGGSSSGGGGGSDIAGGVTQAWVNQNYVSIEFFRKVFKVWAAGETSSDPDVEIMPNDITTTVKNIQAQAGLWTEAFLSALGQGSGGGTGGATTLDQLDDVVITSPTNGQALIYNATTQMWVNGTIQSGTDMATVWSALAAATNEQINASHLSGVLADYVTTTSLQTILGDYLTQTAADQRYITIAYFDRLFRAYNGSTLVSHNDTTTTIDNIKAMFGFWTDMYLSALGRNSAATGLGLDNLTDVTINTPTDGQVLQYNATSSKWENATIQTVVELSGLTDVTLTSLQTNQVLIYDATTQKWVNSSVKTVNGNSIFGTGDIPASGGGGAYLPLSGGTMTGTIYGNTGNGLIISSSNTGAWSEGIRLYPASNNYTVVALMDSSANNVLAFVNNVSTHAHYIEVRENGGTPNVINIPNNAGTFVLDTTNQTISGNKTFTGLVDIYSPDTKYHEGLNIKKSNTGFAILNLYDYYSGSAPHNALMLGFNESGNNEPRRHIKIFDNGVIYILGLPHKTGTIALGEDYVAKTGDTMTGRLTITRAISDTNPGLLLNGTSSNEWAEFFSATYGDRYVGSNLFMSFGVAKSIHNSGVLSFHYGGSANSNCIYLHSFGATATNYLVINMGTANIGIGTGTPSYKLHVAGTIYATGAITALSDARKKDITGEAGVTVEQIAQAPAVQFLWKDKERRKDGQQVGTLAQYWQTVLPEVVMDKGGELSMQYGVAALVSAITIARKVVDHERRIKQLEQENEELKKQLNAA